MKSARRLNEVSVLVRDNRKNRRKLNEFNGLKEVHFGDLSNVELLEKAVRDTSMVIHLAAVIPSVEDNNEDLVTRVNVNGTRNIVKAMERAAPESFLLFSSSVAIYGDRMKNPYIKIGDPLLGADYDHYSKTKVEAESIIESSSLHWSIFRMSAIMGIGNHKISGIMFDVPLETPMEITTVRDTANALVQSIGKESQLNKQIFNMGGGPECRILYKDFIQRAFDAYGMGKLNFPEHAFARQNFHCGYYVDGDKLEEILHFRNDTIDTYFDRFRASVPPIQRLVTRPFSGIVKWFLTRLSEPLKAYKSGDQEKIAFYFGTLDR